jgi:N-acetyl-gamma-glutamyl-phosphate reductase
MQTLPVGIVGASGYSGLEPSRILALHPRVELGLGQRQVGRDRGAPRRPGGAAGKPGTRRRISAPSSRANAAWCSWPPGGGLLELALRILDAACGSTSGAFRLRDAALYPKFTVEHPRPDLLRASYGLPELTPPRAGTRLVANPGCYPTAAALALAPLIEAGLLAPEPLIVDAASGVTGAGRKAAEDYSFAELDGDFRAYKVLRHQHQPEIAQILARSLTFTPHLLPVKRGPRHAAGARPWPGPGWLRSAFLHKWRTRRSSTCWSRRTG